MQHIIIHSTKKKDYNNYIRQSRALITEEPLLILVCAQTYQPRFVSPLYIYLVLQWAASLLTRVLSLYIPHLVESQSRK